MRYTVYSILLVFAAACGHAGSSTSGASQPTAAGAKPGLDVAALAKRESTATLQPFQMASPDNAIAFGVIAAAQPKLEKQANGNYVVIVPIGAESPVQCAVGTAPDLATGSLAQRQGVEKFNEREISEVDAGEMDGAAFIATRTFYVYDNHGTRTVGEIKTAAARQNMRYGAACVHDEVGYGKTLRKVLGSIVSSLKLADDKIKPVYREVGVIKLKDRPIGVTELTVAPTEDGKLWAFSSSSMIVPTTPKDLQGNDEYSAELSTAKGELERGIYVATQGAGEPHFEIKLQRDKGGYHATGKFQGKPVDSAIASKSGLLSPVREAKLLRELVAGKRREVVTSEYHPGTDPTSFGTRRVTRSDDKDFPYKEEDGGLVALSDFDELGLTRKGRMNAGPLALDFTRVVQSGKFPNGK
jgi:hypothetical protein